MPGPLCQNCRDPSCHSMTLGFVGSLNGFCNLREIWGWPVQDSVFFLLHGLWDLEKFGGGQFRTLFFLWILAHREIWGVARRINHPVKWSQKWIFVNGSAISGIPIYFENCCFQCNFKIWGRPKKGSSVHKNQFLRPLYDRYFCHITIVKWSRIIHKSIKKCVF